MILLESILDGIADIRTHMGRTMLQLVGVILGVASIVATFALAAAGKEQSQRFYKESGGIAKIFIWNKQSGKVTDSARAAASKGLTFGDAIAIQKQAREIDLVSPVINEQAVLRYGDREKTREISGVVPAFSPMNDFKVERGRFITDSDIQSASRVVVFGTDRAAELFGSDDPIGKTVTINGTGYTVVGVMEHKFFSFNSGRNALRWMNRQVFVPVTAIMTRRGESLKSGRLGFMHVRMKDTKRAKEAVQEVEEILKREHGVADYEVISRVERMKQNEEQGKMYDITFMVCGIISLFVGGVVVMNIQMASFKERIREVGVRKAIGATGLHVFGQFMAEALLVSALGGIIGIFFGRGFTAAISMLTNEPAIITPEVIVKALVFAAGTGLAFGVYPALKASRLNPIEALRVD
jgi:ABC-type antimicrobial peptide transport system permease subunit